MSKGERCRYSSRFYQEASGCSDCEIYLQRNLDFAGADNRGSIPRKSIAKADFFQDRLSPIINPHPAFANSDLTVSSSDGAIPSRSIPVQVERLEQDARAVYSIQCSLTINSPCNPYVERAGLAILNTTTIIPQPDLSVSHYDYDYNHDYLLAADSTALVHGASSNINSAVTLGLCNKERKKGMGFVCFPHAAPDYSDLLRRCSIGLVPALPSSHRSRPEADWVHGIDGRLPDNYYSHENDMSCMVIYSPCSDLIKVG